MATKPKAAPSRADKTGPAAFGVDGVMVRDYFAANAPKPPDWYFEPGLTIETYAAALARWNLMYADAVMVERGA